MLALQTEQSELIKAHEALTAEKQQARDTVVILTKELSQLQGENAELKVETAKLNKQLIQTATKLASASVMPVMEKVVEEQVVIPVQEVVPAPQPASKPAEVALQGESEAQEEAEDEVLTINVAIMPQGDEFELELPAEISGMDIISELIDAEVLTEDMNFAINLKRTGEGIGGDETLKGIGVRNGDLIVIDTE